MLFCGGKDNLSVGEMTTTLQTLFVGESNPTRCVHLLLPLPFLLCGVVGGEGEGPPLLNERNSSGGGGGARVAE